MGNGKKIFYGCFFSAACLYVVWVNTPRVAHRTELDAIYLARETEFENDQRLYATDVAQNGYLDPTFREMWAIKSQRKTPPGSNSPEGSAARVFEDLAHFNPVCTGRPFKGLEKDVKDNQEVPHPVELYAKSKKDFQRLLPQLLVALEKPVFLAPAVRYDTTTEEPNFIALRRIAQHLAFQSYLDAQDKRADDAARDCLAGIRFAKTVTTHGNLIRLMIGVAMQNIDTRALRGVLLSPNVPREKTCAEIIKSLREGELSEDCLGTAMEYEALMCHNSLQLAFPGSLSSGQPNPNSSNPDWLVYLTNSAFRYSGLLARETRLWENEEYTVIQVAQGKLNKDSLPDRDPSLMDGLLGRRGYFLAPMLMANMRRALEQVLYIRSQMRALQIVAALQGYRARNHSYPKNLQQAKEFGLPEIPKNPLGKDFVYENDGSSARLLIPVIEADAFLLGLNTSHDDSYGYPYKDGFLEFFSQATSGLAPKPE